MNRDAHHLYPLLFKPVLKNYIWGGRNLAIRLGRDLPAGKNIAESWEIAAHPNGAVEVINGPFAGRTLAQLNDDLGPALVGARGGWALERQKFPLLIKLLDANGKLSVQVHPDDEYAHSREANELGKTEMWVVLHAEEGASIILGVKEQTTPDSFRRAIGQGTLEELLHELPVKAGDFVCVPSGSLHAILGGLLIAEIQQSSDVTYRVYDWNRTGHDGKPRPLHIEQAMDVINFDQVTPALPEARLLSDGDDHVKRWELCRNRYFVVERVELAAGAKFEDVCDGGSLQIWGVVDGQVAIEGGDVTLDLEAVRFSLLPAELGTYSITAKENAAQLLRTYLR